MSISFMYHVFGLQSYEYVHQKFEEGGVIFCVRPTWRRLRSQRAIRSGLSDEGYAKGQLSVSHLTPPCVGDYPT